MIRRNFESSESFQHWNEEVLGFWRLYTFKDLKRSFVGYVVFRNKTGTNVAINDYKGLPFMSASLSFITYNYVLQNTVTVPYFGQC